MKVRLLLLATVLGLSACSPAFHREVRDSIDTDVQRAEAHAARTADSPVYRELSAASADGLQFGAPVATALIPAGVPALEQWIRYGQGQDQPLASAAPGLSDVLGVPVRVTQDAIEQASRVLGGGGDPAAGVGQAQEQGFAFQGEGKARVVLDQLVARLGLSWSWSDAGVRIYYLDTRTFDLEILSSDIESKGTITNASNTGGGQSGGGGQGGQGGVQSPTVAVEGGNTQTTDVTYAFNFFDDAETQVKALLSDKGSVAVNESMGTLTVRDNEGVLDAVGTWVEDANQRLTREVEIELTIMTIAQSDTDAFGVDWNLLRANGEFSIDAQTFGEAPLDSNAISATIIDPSSPFAGTSLLVETLRKQANASVQRRTVVRALNNQVVRLQSAVQDGFVVGRSTTLVPDAGSQTSITTLQQTTGLSLTLLPRILDQERVLLQVQGSLSAPLTTKKVEADGLEIEIPRTSLDDVFQRARVRTGSTLVLTTLEQDDLSDEARGIGSARFWPFGGGQRASKSRRMILILLTPRITAG